MYIQLQQNIYILVQLKILVHNLIFYIINFLPITKRGTLSHVYPTAAKHLHSCPTENILLHSKVQVLKEPHWLAIAVKISFLKKLIRF